MLLAALQQAPRGLCPRRARARQGVSRAPVRSLSFDSRADANGVGCVELSDIVGSKARLWSRLSRATPSQSPAAEGNRNPLVPPQHRTGLDAPRHPAAAPASHQDAERAYPPLLPQDEIPSWAWELLGPSPESSELAPAGGVRLRRHAGNNVRAGEHARSSLYRAPSSQSSSPLCVDTTT